MDVCQRTQDKPVTAYCKLRAHTNLTGIKNECRIFKKYPNNKYEVKIRNLPLKVQLAKEASWYRKYQSKILYTKLSPLN